MDNINFNRLKELYYGTNTFNVDSVMGLYNAAKQTRQANQTKYTQKQVREFLKKQETYQVDLAFKKPKKFDAITSEVAGRGLQADLIFFRRSFSGVKFSSRASGEKYVKGGKNYQVGSNLIAYLNVVDINSRKAWSERLPSKGAADVTSAMRKIFNDIQSDGKVVKNLNTDSGKEFLNKDFKNLLDTFFDSPIEHFSSNPKDFAKNGIVERFGHTMRRRVESFVKKIGPNWMGAVPNIMETYNNDPHGTTKEKPDDIWSGGKTSRQQLPRKVRYNLAIGDSVRKVDRKAVFEKGSFAYSPLIYEIVRKERRKFILLNPKTNHTLVRGYLGYELMKVKGAAAERGPGMVQRDVDRNNRRAENQVRAARVGRRLRREGIQPNAARVAPRRRTRGLRPTDMVGKFIKVKFDNQGVLDKISEEMRGNRGRFYRGKVRSYDAREKLHTVYYRSDDTTFYHNFMNPASDSFIKRENWKFD